MEATKTLAVTKVSNVFKSYGKKTVVNDVSFGMYQGEIFGLIGPNGAGKTTIIRMMMDITKPDSGDIRILGEKLGEDTKNKIGYLPEERPVDVWQDAPAGRNHPLPQAGLAKSRSPFGCVTIFEAFRAFCYYHP
jgi:ABC-type branched-subunit amino acid transport system ATPase component